jgi:formylglycine-generating enzyme required for sulfatase activity
MSSNLFHGCRREHSPSRFVRLALAWLILPVGEAMHPRGGVDDKRAIQAAPPEPPSAPATQPASLPAVQPATKSAEVYSDWPFDAKQAAKRQTDTAKALGIKKGLVLNLGKRLAMKLVLIPAGAFIMGSPKPERDNRSVFDDEVQHEVTISKPFYLGSTNVTVAQYAQFVKDTGQQHKEPNISQAGDHPVVNVSWDDAQAFCQWMSKRSGKAVRLPTEAQWEFACRAGTQTRFSFGDKAADLGDYSWYSANNGGTTHPVGQKRPNAWGLFDMHGNAWQWCSEYLGPYVISDKTDPAGPKAGKQRVLRGGSWISDGPANCRSAHRGGDTPATRNPYYGFRVVVALSAD